ncbi:transmembrane protein 26-like [Lineus longissimus]|uniref:transmembrane protein 26-like n=1 Tax=Lineus longissimus TaxID=88925 RepID=UPI002B4DAF3D
MTRRTTKVKRCCKKFFSFVAMVKAVIARFIFFLHGLVAIWRVSDITGEPLFWILAIALLALIAEFIVSLKFKGANESKWFSPVVLLYLASVVPAIWFLELDLMKKRILVRDMEQANNGSLDLPMVSALGKPALESEHGQPVNDTSGEDLDHAEGLSGIHALGLDIHIPVVMAPSEWAKILEQLLMLFLIVGRWLLPKGDLTRDQLSQLLLVNIGMAADIIELFEAFREENVKYNKSLTVVILSLWTSSLMQFTLIMTATKARKTRVAMTRTDEEDGNVRCFCCETEIWAIMTVLFLQDVPFLCLRMTLIFHFSVVSYMNIFFTCKNSLVIMLQLYRIGVIQMEETKKIKKKKRGEISDSDDDESGSYMNRSYPHNLNACRGPPPQVTIVENNEYERNPAVKPVLKRSYGSKEDALDSSEDIPTRQGPYFRRPPNPYRESTPPPRGVTAKKNKVGEMNPGMSEPPGWLATGEDSPSPVVREKLPENHAMAELDNAISELQNIHASIDIKNGINNANMNNAANVYVVGNDTD